MPGSRRTNGEFSQYIAKVLDRHRAQYRDIDHSDLDEVQSAVDKRIKDMTRREFLHVGEAVGAVTLIASLFGSCRAINVHEYERNKVKRLISDPVFFLETEDGTYFIVQRGGDVEAQIVDLVLEPGQTKFIKPHWEILQVKTNPDSLTLLFKNSTEKEGKTFSLTLQTDEVFSILPPARETSPGSILSNTTEPALNARFPFYRVQVNDGAATQESVLD